MSEIKEGDVFTIPTPKGMKNDIINIIKEECEKQGFVFMPRLYSIIADRIIESNKPIIVSPKKNIVKYLTHTYKCAHCNFGEIKPLSK